MTDLLSRLRRRRWPSLTPTDDEARLLQLAHNQALDDVRSALRSGEIRAAIAVVLENTLCSCRRREEPFFGGFCGECEADAVVALLAGGDGCTCVGDICLGVPGDSDENEVICQACMALDPESDCLAATTGGDDD